MQALSIPSCRASYSCNKVIHAPFSARRKSGVGAPPSWRCRRPGRRDPPPRQASPTRSPCTSSSLACLPLHLCTCTCAIQSKNRGKVVTVSETDGRARSWSHRDVAMDSLSRQQRAERTRGSGVNGGGCGRTTRTRGSSNLKMQGTFPGRTSLPMPPLCASRCSCSSTALQAYPVPRWRPTRSRRAHLGDSRACSAANRARSLAGKSGRSPRPCNTPDRRPHAAPPTAPCGRNHTGTLHESLYRPCCKTNCAAAKLSLSPTVGESKARAKVSAPPQPTYCLRGTSAAGRCLVDDEVTTPAFSPEFPERPSVYSEFV